jgi:hypothetical protein
MMVSGWHGSDRKIEGPLRATCSSEGCGVYFSDTKAFAAHFGRPRRVLASVRRPLVVDGEDMPALEGNLHLGYFRDSARDSEWIRANYYAAEKADLLMVDRDRDREIYFERLFGRFAVALTEHLRRHGYDSILFKLQVDRLPDRFREDPKLAGREIQWWVVFDARKVELD